LFGNGKRIVNLDAKVADRAFHLGMAEQKLDRAQIARAAVNESRFRPTVMPSSA
jgi:hypothetical protein